MKKAPESFAASIFRAARETIEETLDASKEKVSDTADDLQQEGRKLVKSTRTYVRKNPYSLLFSALAAGLVLGLIIRRR